MDVLTLTCWIRSEDPNAIFRVKVSKTETVSDLQEVIKNKKPVAFRDVDADTLALYRPNNPISPPYKDHFCKFNLSAHSESLETWQMLSDVFPEQPPLSGIHVIVDAPSEIVCWLRGVDLDDSFQIPIHPREGIRTLIPRIKDAQPRLKNVANHLIRLYKISGDESELQEYLNKIGGGERLKKNPLARDFLDVPVLEPLRVVIDSREIQSPALLGGEPISPGNNGLEDYRDIFLKVKNWSGFEKSDIQTNSIEEVGNMTIPDFVTDFERKLDRKPHFPYLPLDGPLSQTSDIGIHFEPSVGEGVRDAGLSEVGHTINLVTLEWEKCWESNGHRRCPLKERGMDSVFFDVFLLAAKNGRAAITQRNQSWPITVVVQRQDERRRYRPRSNFLISNFNLPRLLVEVNSTLEKSWPTDLIRMLATGAFIVRFANNFVSTFNREKDFVLCAFFIWDNGNATRFTLFQQIQNEKVYYKKESFSLNFTSGRVKFARHLYSLLSVEFDKDQDSVSWDAISKLDRIIKGCHMKSMHTKPPVRRSDRKRARTESSHDNPASGGENDTGQLRAHGYEVELKVFVDDHGGTWESLLKTPDHILTVYKRTNPNKMFIAKKVREESDELEILKLLNTTRLKSDHVISLVDSFNGWAIVPKMTTIGYYLDFSRKELRNKVPQVCLGLVEGLAYLHRLCIAHRDIKPDNLVVDKNFTLQIIDFDVAMQVKDEDQEVDDQCGTEGWMAPEVEKKLWHSPIKADRWSCGRVLLFLLGVSDKEDISLKVFAGNLEAHDPKQRPSLLEWDRYLAPPFSDSDASKTSQLRRDQAEGDGEMMKPPNAKKRRLDLGGLRGPYGLGLMDGVPVELVK